MEITAVAEGIDSLLEEIPSLIKRVRNDPKRVLQARGALMDYSEAVVNACAKEGRAMKQDEARRVDASIDSMSEINSALAEYKRWRNSVNDSGLPVILAF